jgi:hypothetical protein
MTRRINALCAQGKTTVIGDSGSAGGETARNAIPLSTAENPQAASLQRSLTPYGDARQNAASIATAANTPSSVKVPQAMVVDPSFAEEFV